MSKKVKIALAIGLQLAMIASIGDFVGWPYMKYVLITAIIFFGLTIIFFIADNIKD
ncbi:MAG: hypothetical protein KAH72_01190 [Flavobacteriaceae bacterium]|nr:hypothetical protein [Flavobacteriaceae bacterium]